MDRLGDSETSGPGDFEWETNEESADLPTGSRDNASRKTNVNVLTITLLTLREIDRFKRFFFRESNRVRDFSFDRTHKLS